MKNLLRALALLLSVSFFTDVNAQSFSGAWNLNGDKNHLLLVQDGYFAWTQINDQGEFVNTMGGQVKENGSHLDIVMEFNADDATLAGTAFTTTFKQDGDKLEIQHPEGYLLKWDRIPEQDQGLAGLWRITARESDGEMHSIAPSARVTYKLLTPGHFQWMAINKETGQFFGTGGGVYTFKNGKYTEHIEFFSRDNSRAGASLEFDGELKDGDWHHSGKSSAGKPIYEVWSKEEL